MDFFRELLIGIVAVFELQVGIIGWIAASVLDLFQ